MLVRDLVQVEESLVDRLLQIEGGSDGLQTGAPGVLGRLLDVPEDDAAATVVLKLHERLGVLQLFGSGLAEVLGEAWEGHIVPFEVEGLMCVRGERERETGKYKGLDV